MSKVVTAEYDTAENAFRLVAPLEKLTDDEDVNVTVKLTPKTDRWALLRSTVTTEQMDELATVIDEMFPVEK